MRRLPTALMAIRLIALDLDGTLLDSRGELSERNREAINSARARGVSVALVTGRRFRDARPLALALRLDALVSDDHVGEGTLVYDHISEGNTALAKYIAWTRRVVGDDAARAIRRVASLDEYLDHDPLHIAFSGGCSAIE